MHGKHFRHLICFCQRYAIERSDFASENIEFIAHYDNNAHVNRCYRYNFGAEKTKSLRKEDCKGQSNVLKKKEEIVEQEIRINIEHLKVAKLESHRCDLLM